MNVDHTRNLIILNDLDYVKEFYDFDSKTKSFGITENGMRALICWNRIHGLKDSLKITEKCTQKNKTNSFSGNFTQS